MSDETHEATTRKDWQDATDAQRKARKKAPTTIAPDPVQTEAGEKALAFCRKMLAEIVEPAPEPAAPCEHDYQPTPIFARTLRCTLCGSFIEAELPKSAVTDGAPLDSYKDLTQ